MDTKGQPNIRPPAHAAHDATLAVVALVISVLAFWALLRCMPDFAEEVKRLRAAPSVLPALRSDVFPEPRERRLYQLGIVIAAVVPIASYMGLRLVVQKSARLVGYLAVPWVSSARNLFIFFASASWLYMIARHTEIPGSFRLVADSVGMAALIAVSTKLRVPYWSWGRYVVLAGVGVVAFRLGFCQKEMILAERATRLHVDLLFGAINQVSHGATILVDSSSQYGIGYPYVLSFLLKPVGVTANSICASFTVLELVSFAWIYLVIRRAAKELASSIFVEVAFLSVVGILASFTLAAFFDLQWIYYQYFPLRVVWGCFFFWYIGFYARLEPKRKLRFGALGYALAGFSVLWNLDTGIVILTAWVASLMFDSCARAPWSVGKATRAAGIHCGAALLTMALMLGGYDIFAYLRSGHWAQYGELFRFQSLFYVVGYYMLPMKEWELWQAFIVLPAVSLFVSLRSWLVGTANAGSTERVFVALFGLGIFSYYQGRSHVHVLLVVAYPATLLGCLHFIDLITRRSTAVAGATDASGTGFEHLMKGLALFLPGFGLVTMSHALPRMATVLLDSPPPAAMPELATLAMLRSRHAGTEVPIVSEDANFIHLETGTWSPFHFASTTEIMTQEQVDDLNATIQQRKYSRVIVRSPTWSFVPSLTVPLVSFEAWANETQGAEH